MRQRPHDRYTEDPERYEDAPGQAPEQYEEQYEAQYSEQYDDSEQCDDSEQYEDDPGDFTEDGMTEEAPPARTGVYEPVRHQADAPELPVTDDPMFFEDEDDIGLEEPTCADEEDEAQADSYAGMAEEPLPPDDRPTDDAAKEKRSIFRPSERKPHFVLSVIVNALRILAVVILLAGLAAVGAVIGIAKGYVETCPTLDLAALDGQAQTSFIYDCNGDLITEYKGTENRVMVSIASMPKLLQYAFVAVEDSRFYSHNGIDLKRIVGAFVSNLTSSSTQGGSTITQQLIKNTVLSSEQSYKRKIQEAYLAIQLETVYTKDEILECYLNTIWLGESYYGVQVAAQGYFGKDLGELTLRECAMLAGVCNSPYYYNPRRNFYTRSKEGVDYPAITNDRTDYVLRCMYENQFITKEQYEAALDPSTATVLETDPTSGSSMYKYPHYVEYAVSETVDILLQLNGLEDTSANRAAMENKLRTGGYRVQLAIDTSIQETVQSTISSWSKYPSLRDPSDKVYRSTNSDGTYTEITEPQAAAVVLDYRTGEIKAIVGSRDTPTARKTLNRATDMKMPVGSSIKPIAVYAPALELGASPASVVYNIPLPIKGWTGDNGKDTWPKNYGGKSYTGPETFRTAMSKSHNVGAAYALMNYVGVSNSVSFLHQLGVDDDHIDATPFGLSLGSSGITPMQMTVAYGVLANGGVYQTPISVLGISDSEGNVLWDGHANQERHRVFSSSTAYMIVDMLKSDVPSGNNAYIKGQTVGGKTGTNSDQRGVFFSGVTGYYASALWIGHDNYKPLASSATGNGAAAPLWQSYMSKIHKGLSNRDIMEGSYSDYGLVKVKTCVVSGQLATEACENDVMGYGVTTDYWRDGTQPTVSCQMHSTQAVCTDSGMLAGQYCTSVEYKGVVTIPIGHPLYSYIGTEYESVLEQYLGTGVTSGSTVCTLHTAYSSTPATPSTEEDTSGFASDARRLLTQAYTMMQGMDPNDSRYTAMFNACASLETVLANNGSQSEIINAMSALTLAMAAAN